MTDYFLLGPEIGIGFFGYTPKYKSQRGNLEVKNDYYIHIKETHSTECSGKQAM